MKNIKTAYMAPMVEVLNARVEKGFAGSTVTPTPDGPIGGGRFTPQPLDPQTNDIDFD